MDGGTSTTFGGVAAVSGAMLVSGLESVGCGMGAAATGGDAFTVFCSQPVTAKESPQTKRAAKVVAFVLWLGITFFLQRRAG